ncbi:conserved hypothetical protein [Paraburkholderia caribensis]|uniref:hypothetical protein n=1 Tax=Paraburkholderia caribensis TaxID=75105 RepID=UPI001CAF9460|nr:hypothetical protein [Paraburkholderia caribensis]CAG9194105.1 conserved hypothetical protein [Paraburkholderia caribensis]
MNVKAGDMAIVTGSPVPEINGQIVEVLSLFGELLGEGLAWLCTCHSMRDEGYPSLPIPDSMLRPISGVPVRDEQLDEVTA